MVEELVMDRRIVWDSKNLQQVDEAKSIIMPFKRSGYEILTVDDDGKEGPPMKFFRPYFKEVVIKARQIGIAGKRVMKILCEKGDDRIVWDRDNGREAKEAKKKFSDLLAKGYKAYSVNVEGMKNRRIHEFDVDAEEILMIPKTAKG